MKHFLMVFAVGFLGMSHNVSANQDTVDMVWLVSKDVEDLVLFEAPIIRGGSIPWVHVPKIMTSPYVVPAVGGTHSRDINGLTCATVTIDNAQEIEDGISIEVKSVTLDLSQCKDNDRYIEFKELAIKAVKFNFWSASVKDKKKVVKVLE